MIWTVIQIHLRRLMHSRVELLLTFVVPIVFFSVFALIFGKGIGTGATPKIKVVIVDEVQSEASAAIADSLKSNDGLRFLDDIPTASRSKAQQMVRRGTITIGIVLAEQEEAELFSPTLRAELLVDASDQVATQVVSALVMQELIFGGIDVAPSDASEAATGAVRQASGVEDSSEGATVSSAEGYAEGYSEAEAAEWSQAPEPSAVSVVDVIGEGKSNPVVSMYAAGIAVMFLLFGASGGGGALLEERENATLDRLLSTGLSMDQLLIGKWLYLTALGFVQVCIMFLWGQLVFQIDLWGHLDGFLMMTLVTSLAAAAFGLFLATLCKSRGQLNGLSVILILTMSALGGSMVPRYVMSQKMQEIGLLTFNAWALDGYDKVFWRDLSVESLWPELTVLLLSGIAFLLLARALALRWEFDLWLV